MKKEKVKGPIEVATSREKLSQVHWEMSIEEMGKEKIQYETCTGMIHAASHMIE